MTDERDQQSDGRYDALSDDFEDFAATQAMPPLSAATAAGAIADLTYGNVADAARLNANAAAGGFGVHDAPANDGFVPLGTPAVPVTPASAATSAGVGSMDATQVFATGAPAAGAAGLAGFEDVPDLDATRTSAYSAPAPTDATAAYGAPVMQAAPADFAAPAAPEDLNPGAVTKRRSHKGLIITLCVVLALLAALVGSFLYARAHYTDRVAPGVRFGIADVTGKTRDELAAIVQQAVKDSGITVKDSNGASVTASLEDLGVNVDVDKTVDDLMNAKASSNLIEDVKRVLPFVHENVPLSATTDNGALDAFLSEKLIGEDERAVPSSIAYDGGQHLFTAVEGRSGKAPKSDDVKTAVGWAIADPGMSTTLTIDDETIDTPIALDTAQSAADAANQRLTNKIVMTAGDAKQFEVPVDDVASWIKAEPDSAKGTIELSYDATAIRKYMAEQLPAQLNQDMVSQEDIVDENGAVLVEAQTAGVNGVAVKDTDQAAEQVVAALETGNGAQVQVAADVTQFDVKQKKSEWRIVVDKSTQLATVYQNGNAVKTFNICTGTNNHQTTNGTWYIYLKYRIQDMTGLNDDGSRYLSKGVEWVSYFNGGEGFHTATWNYDGIADGDPVSRGSHGCVNMYASDAQWVYQNCPEGTIVQVVGSQPSGSVR